jgi:hypothetical protein
MPQIRCHGTLILSERVARCVPRSAVAISAERTAALVERYRKLEQMTGVREVVRLLTPARVRTAA